MNKKRKRDRGPRPRVVWLIPTVAALLLLAGYAFVVGSQRVVAQNASDAQLVQPQKPAPAELVEEERIQVEDRVVPQVPQFSTHRVRSTVPVQRTVTVTLPNDDKIMPLVEKILRAQKTDEKPHVVSDVDIQFMGVAVDVEQLKKELTEILGAQFNAMHERQAAEIQSLTSRLDKLKQQHEKRLAAREEIIARRMNELLGIPDPLAWHVAGGQPRPNQTATTVRRSINYLRPAQASAGAPANVPLGIPGPVHLPGALSPPVTAGVAPAGPGVAGPSTGASSFQPVQSQPNVRQYRKETRTVYTPVPVTVTQSVGPYASAPTNIHSLQQSLLAVLGQSVLARDEVKWDQVERFIAQARTSLDSAKEKLDQLRRERRNGDAKKLEQTIRSVEQAIKQLQSRAGSASRNAGLDVDFDDQVFSRDVADPAGSLPLFDAEEVEVDVDVNESILPPETLPTDEPLSANDDELVPLN